MIEREMTPEARLREEGELALHEVDYWFIIDNQEWGLVYLGRTGSWTIIVSKLAYKHDQAHATATHTTGKVFIYPAYWATIAQRKAERKFQETLAAETTGVRKREPLLCKIPSLKSLIDAELEKKPTKHLNGKSNGKKR